MKSGIPVVALAVLLVTICAPAVFAQANTPIYIAEMPTVERVMQNDAG